MCCCYQWYLSCIFTTFITSYRILIKLNNLHTLFDLAYLCCSFVLKFSDTLLGQKSLIFLLFLCFFFFFQYHWKWLLHLRFAYLHMQQFVVEWHNPFVLIQTGQVWACVCVWVCWYAYSQLNEKECGGGWGDDEINIRYLKYFHLLFSPIHLLRKKKIVFFVNWYLYVQMCCSDLSPDFCPVPSHLVIFDCANQFDFWLMGSK